MNLFECCAYRRLRHQPPNANSNTHAISGTRNRLLRSVEIKFQIYRDLSFTARTATLIRCSTRHRALVKRQPRQRPAIPAIATATAQLLSKKYVLKKGVLLVNDRTQAISKWDYYLIVRWALCHRTPKPTRRARASIVLCIIINRFVHPPGPGRTGQKQFIVCYNSNYELMCVRQPFGVNHINCNSNMLWLRHTPNATKPTIKIIKYIEKQVATRTQIECWIVECIVCCSWGMFDGVCLDYEAWEDFI